VPPGDYSRENFMALSLTPTEESELLAGFALDRIGHLYPPERKVGIEEPPTPEVLARGTITVKQLGEKFAAEYTRPKIKDAETYRRRARGFFENHINPLIGARAAASVEPKDVDRLRDTLSAKGGAGSSVMQVLAALSKAFNWGRKQGLIDCANPVSGCERPGVAAVEDYLSREECGDLLVYAEMLHTTFVASPDVRELLYPMIATALYSGLRKGELLGLEWSSVHLEEGRIDVRRSYQSTPKSGKTRYVPISPRLAPILRAWKARCTSRGLVFPVDGRMGREDETLALDAALNAAGCHEPKDKPWHLLRHTFASHFMMAGGNILTLQKLLGHADLKTTMRYAHLAPDAVAAEVARVDLEPRQPASVVPLRA
jgi:integrase